MNYRENAYRPSEECCGGCDHPAHKPGWCPKCYLDSGCNATRRRLAEIDGAIGGVVIYVVVALLLGATLLPWRELLAICAWVALAIVALCSAVLTGAKLVRVVARLWVDTGPIARAMRASASDTTGMRVAPADERETDVIDAEGSPREDGGSAIEFSRHAHGR